ncbi:hypothetical protein ACFXNW_24790 [Nocardia sp. NPDC059180]|uniref:hypothetical protein n=1 Tax=Nocardia sp. NPDC059180 TaxID=3346761 RepID=UPI00368BE9A0
MHDDSERGGQVFRQAWITGVSKHYPGTPKDSYIVPWVDTPDWERASAAAVYQQVANFIGISGGNTRHLERAQKSQFVALCWIAQIYKHIDNPKAGYVAPWDQLPEWQQETDADIFEAVELDVTAAN